MESRVAGGICTGAAARGVADGASEGAGSERALRFESAATGCCPRTARQIAFCTHTGCKLVELMTGDACACGLSTWSGGARLVGCRRRRRRGGPRSLPGLGSESIMLLTLRGARARSGARRRRRATGGRACLLRWAFYCGEGDDGPPGSGVRQTRGRAGRCITLSREFSHSRRRPPVAHGRSSWNRAASAVLKKRWKEGCASLWYGTPLRFVQVGLVGDGGRPKGRSERRRTTASVKVEMLSAQDARARSRPTGAPPSSSPLGSLAEGVLVANLC